MRIYKMTATFGKLEHDTLTLEPGLNVIEAPNEWGKSTWCAFLLAMLYGLDTRAKTTRSSLADKERYAPWSGSPMAGRIDLNWQGRDITIERSTKGRIPMGEFRAYETASGLTVPELTAHTCGEKLLGVEQSVFRRAGFIRLTDLPVTQDDALRRRLNALVTTGDESGDGERLARELKELKNRCRYNRTGLLPQAEAEREALEARLEELAGLEQQCRKLKERIGEAKSWLRELENHEAALCYAESEANAERLAQARDEHDRAQNRLTELENNCANLPDREETEQKLSQLRSFQTQWNSAQMERQLLPEPPQPPEPAAPFRGLSGEEALDMVQKDVYSYETVTDPAPLRIYWGLGALGILVSAVLFFLTDWPYGLIALGAALMMVGMGARKRHQMAEKAGQYREKYGSQDPDLWLTLARRYDSALKTYQNAHLEYRQLRGDLDSRLESLEKLRQSLCGAQIPEKVMEIWQQNLWRWEEYHLARREMLRTEQHLQTLRELIRPAPVPDLEDSLAFSGQETRQRIAETQAEQQRLLSRLGQYQGRMEALGRREELSAELEQVTKRIGQLERTHTALTLALETLAEARQELQRRFAPRISARARELMGKMTSGRYDRLTLSQDFSLLTGAGEEDILQSALWRSDGTVDQLYLALRLAVAEELTPEAPLVLDDALVRFDDGRLKAAMEILREISGRKQVILFTCQSREKNTV